MNDDIYVRNYRLYLLKIWLSSIALVVGVTSTKRLSLGLAWNFANSRGMKSTRNSLVMCEYDIPVCLRSSVLVSPLGCATSTCSISLNVFSPIPSFFILVIVPLV